ncbi:MAG: ATP-grasp domain-containing protein, partial [Flavobacteriaceae bacterium]|nr:ATP-grasp domain-containing protein [Flavobacteriaceae bacterium]
SETLKYNDKASFKLICQQLKIPVVEGVSFEMKPLKNENYNMMENIIKGYLQSYSTVILRGALGEFGMSLYKTQGNDIAKIYKEISATGEKIIIIEPFLNVSSSPGDQWAISRDGAINHLGMQDQICKEGMIHTGTISTVVHSVDDSAYIIETSRKIVNEMAKTGYIGVVGIDCIVSDEGIFPVENNARFNGSSYPILIVDQIKQLNIQVPVWKFIKFKTTPCTFIELQNRLRLTIFDGKKANSIFPFNCEALSNTGNLSFIFLAENMSQISDLEEQVRGLQFDREQIPSKG